MGCYLIDQTYFWKSNDWKNC